MMQRIERTAGLSLSPSLLLFTLCVVGCGANPDSAATLVPTPTVPPEQATATVQPSPNDQTPTDADQPETLFPVSIVMGEVVETAGFAPSGMTFAGTPGPNGTIEVQLTGLGGTCDSNPNVFAYRSENETISLAPSSTGPTARCPAHFSMNFTLGPLRPGSYDFQLVGSLPFRPLGSATAQAPSRLAPPGDPDSQFATSAVQVEPAPIGAGLGVAIKGEPTDHILTLTVTTSAPCQQGSLGFSASLDENELVIQPHQPVAVARCASLIRTYELRIAVGNTRPGSVRLNDAGGSEVARLTRS